MDITRTKWLWNWSVLDGEPYCGVYAELRPGHAYSICRCPRYLTKEQWTEYATHNAWLKRQGE